MWSGLFEAVPDALVVVDGAGLITHANRNAEVLFGYSPNALIGQPIERLMPEAVRARHHVHRARYMTSARVRPMGGGSQTLTGMRSDGQHFPVEIALSPIDTDAGLRYLASVRDVSESLRVRQALIRARYDAVIAAIGQLALEARDIASVLERLPTLLADALAVDSIAIVMSRTDSTRIDVRVASGARDDWPDPSRWLDAALWPGRSGRSDTEAVITSADALADFPGIHSAAFMPLYDRDHSMGALIALSGKQHFFDHDAMHLLRSTAFTVATLVQRRRAEEQLAHAQRLDAIGQLTGGIAHDFNNLLTVISGSLQLLELECGERPEVGSLIASASRSVARGAEMTGKLLTFARRQRLNPSAVLLVDLLADLEVMLKRTLGDSIRLAIDCGVEAPPVYVDAAQLDTALINLALNARDAMPHGGNIDIHVSAQRVGEEDDLAGELASGPYVRITVADNGHGMTAQVLARALDPFFTTKESGRGSGLGLSMVYGFVKQSGGHMHMQSQPGEGTRVDIYLPAAGSLGALVEPPVSSVMPVGDETVLVVEDETDVLNIAAAFLQSLGYRVRRAVNAKEALEHLATDRAIALLFSDVMLGSGMTGVELARAARQQFPGLPVLLTSGYAHPETGSAAADGSAFELLRKPYRREQLAAAVRRQLAHSRVTSQES